MGDWIPPRTFQATSQFHTQVVQFSEAKLGLRMVPELLPQGGCTLLKADVSVTLLSSMKGSREFRALIDSRSKFSWISLSALQGSRYEFDGRNVQTTFQDQNGNEFRPRGKVQLEWKSDLFEQLDPLKSFFLVHSQSLEKHDSPEIVIGSDIILLGGFADRLRGDISSSGTNTTQGRDETFYPNPFR